MKISVLAATAVATLVIAGCGGDDSSSNQALSYDEFGTATSEVCESVSATVDPISAKLKGEAEPDAAVFEELVPALQDGSDELAALDPPEELQATFDDYVANIEMQEAGAVDAQEAAEAGDQEEYLRLLETVDQISTDGDLLASKLGAAGCID